MRCRYLYRPTLAFDANFRLKNLVRQNERHDPELGDGYGYFVKQEEYKKHIKSYVSEVDVGIVCSILDHYNSPVTSRLAHASHSRPSSRRIRKQRRVYASRASLELSAHATS